MKRHIDRQRRNAALIRELWGSPADEQADFVQRACNVRSEYSEDACHGTGILLHFAEDADGPILHIDLLEDVVMSSFPLTETPEQQFTNPGPSPASTRIPDQADPPCSDDLTETLRGPSP